MYLSKAQYEGVSREFPVKGKAVSALKRWLERKTVNYIFKERALLAGLDVDKFSAHSLRSGFVTSVASKGIPVWEIMQLTNHKTSRSVDDYYRSHRP